MLFLPLATARRLRRSNLGRLAAGVLLTSAGFTSMVALTGCGTCHADLQGQRATAAFSRPPSQEVDLSITYTAQP